MMSCVVVFFLDMRSCILSMSSSMEILFQQIMALRFVACLFVSISFTPYVTSLVQCSFGNFQVRLIGFFMFSCLWTF